MPDEIIFCPSCNHKLRVPQELLGQIVQCPMCRLVFKTPTPGGNVPQSELAPPPPPSELPPREPPVQISSYQPAPWSDERHQRDRAAAILKPPAICLLIAGALGLLVHLFQIGIGLLMPDATRSFYVQMGIAPPPRETVMISTIVGGALFSLISGGVIAGAVQMLTLRSYGLALAGSILALINCGNGCCLLCLPFGIWSLVVLNRSDVREAFR